MPYRHTQWGRLPLLVAPPAALAIVLAWTQRDPEEPLVALIVIPVVGLLAAILSGLFTSLTVTCEGRELRVHFGPLPLIRRRIPLSDIRACRAARSSLLDGWGIHRRTGHGWIWNVWGFDCVELELSGDRRFRIGTDDVEGLVAALENRRR